MWLDLKTSPEERDLLLDILTTYRGALRTEIHRTEVSASKRDLKEQEELLGCILGELRELKPSAAGALYATGQTVTGTGGGEAAFTQRRHDAVLPEAR